MHPHIPLALALAPTLFFFSFFLNIRACTFDLHSGDVTTSTAFVQASFNHPSCRSRPSLLHSTASFTYYAASARHLPLASHNLTVTAWSGLDPRQYPGGYVAKVRLFDLKPATRYVYHFVSPSGKRSPLGSFRTLPMRGHVRFVVLTQFNRPPYRVAWYAKRVKPHFAILNGDTVYVSKPWLSLPPNPNPAPDGQEPDPEPTGAGPVSPTIEYYRKLYATEQRNASYGGGPWVPDILRSVSSFAMFDDHELYSDVTVASGRPRVVLEDRIDRGDGPDGLPIVVDRIPRRRLSAFVKLGLEAVGENYAITPSHILQRTDPLPKGTSVYNDLTRMFRKVTLPDADVFLLDLRQYRDTMFPVLSYVPVLPEGVGRNFTCEGRFANPALCAVLPGPHGTTPWRFRGKATRRRTMLGHAQLQWLKQGLKASKKKFKIIMSTCIFANIFVDAEESWHGYWSERASVLRFIDANDVDNVVFLSSGLFGAMITEIDPNPAKPGKNVVYEILSGPTGSFTTGQFLGPLTSVVEDFVRTFAENSHTRRRTAEGAVKFARFDRPNFLRVDISNGKLHGQIIGADGKLVKDRKGNVGKISLG